jgi:hypothetical protein
MPFGRACEEPSDNEAAPAVMSESREIRLPEDLCAAAEKKFAGKFGSLDELVAFLLHELVHGDTLELDQAEQAAVEQRLKDLGYL